MHPFDHTCSCADCKALDERVERGEITLEDVLHLGTKGCLGMTSPFPVFLAAGSDRGRPLYGVNDLYRGSHADEARRVFNEASRRRPALIATSTHSNR